MVTQPQSAPDFATIQKSWRDIVQGYIISLEEGARQQVGAMPRLGMVQEVVVRVEQEIGRYLILHYITRMGE